MRIGTCDIESRNKGILKARDYILPVFFYVLSQNFQTVTNSFVIPVRPSAWNSSVPTTRSLI